NTIQNKQTVFTQCQVSNLRDQYNLLNHNLSLMHLCHKFYCSFIIKAKVENKMMSQINKERRKKGKYNKNKKKSFIVLSQFLQIKISLSKIYQKSKQISSFIYVQNINQIYFILKFLLIIWGIFFFFNFIILKIYFNKIAHIYFIYICSSFIF
ncbi:transmembrane protein, putative, partial (macronuclear) [Tetrahymena thermophila SB210]